MILLLKEQVASLFTNDMEVLAIGSKLAQIISVSQFLEGFNIMCCHSKTTG